MNWNLGRVAGIPINVHWSFWLLPLLVLFSAAPAGGSLTLRLTLLFLVFGCVVLHELGHAMMARLFEVRTRDITLYPIGGIARLERMPRHPFAEGAIALAGPAVNVVIAAFLAVAWGVLGGLVGSFSGAILQTLLYANVVLVLFNLLPVFPMDGGRVLRAILGAFVPFTKATRISARVGQAFAALLGIIGLFTGGMLVFLAIFVFFAAQAELTMVRQQERFAQAHPGAFDFHPARDAAPSAARGDGARSSGASVLLDQQGRVIAKYG